MQRNMVSTSQEMQSGQNFVDIGLAKLEIV